MIALCRLHGLAPMLAVLVGIAAMRERRIGDWVTGDAMQSLIVHHHVGIVGRGAWRRQTPRRRQRNLNSTKLDQPSSANAPPGRKWMIVPPGVWLLLILSLFVTLVLRYTRFGRHVFAIGSNEHTARLCGVPVTRTKLLIFVFATIFAGIAGVLQFSYLNNLGDPTTANGYELNVIARRGDRRSEPFRREGQHLGTLIGSTADDDGGQRMQQGSEPDQRRSGHRNRRDHRRGGGRSISSDNHAEQRNSDP